MCTYIRFIIYFFGDKVEFTNSFDTLLSEHVAEED